MTLPAKEDTFTSEHGVTSGFPMHLWLNNTGNQRVLREARESYVRHVDRLFGMIEGKVLESKDAWDRFSSASVSDQVQLAREVVLPRATQCARNLQSECIVNVTTMVDLSLAVAKTIWEDLHDTPEQK